MYIICLATDYDGTIAHNGVVDELTIQALVEFKRSGRKLVLVTGRKLPDLSRCFSRLDLFDRVVAENGALLYAPASKKEQPLAPKPSESFIEMLRAARVAPLSVGRSIVATWEPNEKTVLEAIRDLGLELQIVFNKGAVMVLPANVNKASGLRAALDDLGLSAHNVVAVGDAENDHAFMRASGFAVAVANALRCRRLSRRRSLSRSTPRRWRAPLSIASTTYSRSGQRRPKRWRSGPVRPEACGAPRRRGSSGAVRFAHAIPRSPKQSVRMPQAGRRRTPRAY